MKRLVHTCSSSRDKGTSPLIALPTLIRLEVTTLVSLLYLSNSCCNTVFIESSYLIGCFLDAAWISYGFGTLANRSAAISLRTSSYDFPDSPELFAS